MITWSFAASVATSCAAGEQPTASITITSGSRQTLYAYQLAPAPATRQAEDMANKVYGKMLGARSPQVRYYCTWRPTSPTGFVSAKEAGPPEQIIMGCAFGTEPWTPPVSLIEEAKAIEHRHEATLIIMWKRDRSSFVPIRIDVDIRSPGARPFRSANLGSADLSQIGLVSGAMTFPTDRQQPLSFEISASLPYRLNAGEKAAKPVVSIKAQGIAVPTPKWLNY